MQSKSLFPNNQSDGGGGNNGSSSKSNKKGNQRADTGKVQNGNNNGNGNGGSVAETVKKEDTTVNDQALPPDKDIESLFQDSPEFKAFDKRNQNASPEVYAQRYADALARFIGSREAGKTEAPATGPSRPLDVFRRTPSVPQTEAEIAVDLQHVNPHWNDPDFNLVAGTNTSNRQNHMHRVNCQRCVVAYEARRKGYEVTAVSVEDGWMPAPWVDSMNTHDVNQLPNTGQIASLFELPDGSAPQWEQASSVNRIPAVNQLESKILAWGDGARGIVYAAWMRNYGGGAHVFSVEVKDGKILYLDPQSGKTNYGSGADPNYNWKMRFSPSNALMALRVDNADIKQDGTTWMRDRNNIQVNIPSKSELSAHIDGKPALDQFVWSHIWQQLRSGERPTLPARSAEYNTPEAAAIAREALLWLRRPD